MRYLLDTHTFLWAVSNPSQLGERAAEIFSDPESVLFLSTAVTWEIVIKSGLGKLKLPHGPEYFILHNIKQHNLNVLDISMEDTFGLLTLPDIHKDPFDRLLIAQARRNMIPIVTKDEVIRSYDVHTLW
jgi:PIN domain nuclease of toxin-antitoxin system